MYALWLCYVVLWYVLFCDVCCVCCNQEERERERERENREFKYLFTTIRLIFTRQPTISACSWMISNIVELECLKNCNADRHNAECCIWN